MCRQLYYIEKEHQLFCNLLINIYGSFEKQAMFFYENVNLNMFSNSLWTTPPTKKNPKK